MSGRDAGFGANMAQHNMVIKHVDVYLIVGMVMEQSNNMYGKYVLILHAGVTCAFIVALYEWRYYVCRPLGVDFSSVFKQQKNFFVKTPA